MTKSNKLNVNLFLSEKQCQSLEESAREYQAKHGVRPEYKEIEVKTGEEDESNVLQVIIIGLWLLLLHSYWSSHLGSPGYDAKLVRLQF